VDDNVTTNEDTPVSGNVLTNDTDPDADQLTVTKFTVNGSTYAAGATAVVPGIGTIVIQANGNYVFTPAKDYNGTVPSIVYTATDPDGNTSAATLSITVKPINDAPVAKDDSYTGDEDMPVNGVVLPNDSDVDGDTLSVVRLIIGGTTYSVSQSITLPGIGVLTMDAKGKFVFSPTKDFNGAVPEITYVVSDGKGGEASAKLTIGILSVADPEDVSVSATSICTNNIATLTATSTVTNPVFRWYGDPGLQLLLFVGPSYTTRTLTATITYYVTVSGTDVLENKANNAKSVQVTVTTNTDRLTITPESSPALCPGSSVTLAASTATGYQWYKDGVLISGATAQRYTTNVVGVYTVIGFNANGCPSPASDAITVSNAPVPQASIITADKLSVCSGENAVITSSVATGNQWYRDGNLINGATQQTYSATVTGSYTVIVTNSNGCRSAASNIINVVVNPIPSSPTLRADGDVKMCQDDIRVISTTIPAGYTIQWFSNDVLIANAKKDTIHITGARKITAKLVSASGCTSAASNAITTEILCQTGVMMPELFTPNDDGINDVIKPIPLGVKTFRCFKVYDRWGALVFETTDRTKGWDGNYKGKRQPNDSYIWIVEGVDYKGNTIKKTGVFTLVR
jgi:gliding motility-associated-like protein